MEYGIESVKNTLKRMAEALISMETVLTDIDSKLGDGDMGLSMAGGARAILSCLEGQQDSISACLEACAAAFNRAAPSTMGTLLSVATKSVGAAFKGKDVLTEADVAQIPRLMLNTITKFGKAKVGDKTIVDALSPFAEVFEQEFAQTQTFSAALEAARAGMESTKGMEARMGRARWLRGRNAEFPDGGCVMLVEVVESL